MKLKALIIASIIAFFTPTVKASDLIDTEPAPKLFTFGARLGVNASNRTFSSAYFDTWNVNSWGTGIDVGAVANINFKRYLSIQPGIFFQSRSGNYSYATPYLTNQNETETFYELGHMRSYNFNIPIMGVLRLSVMENFQWLVELGPYFQFRLHSSDGNQIIVPVRSPSQLLYDKRYAESNFFDFGIKFGSGIQVFDHYYFGIHYMAGICDVWKFPKGGKNKAWTFSIGYNF